jgi:hypothetical protein
VIRILTVPDRRDLSRFDKTFRTVLGGESLGFSVHIHGRKFATFLRKTKSHREALWDCQLSAQERFLYTCSRIDLWKWEFWLLDSEAGSHNDAVPVCPASRGGSPPESCGGPARLSADAETGAGVLKIRRNVGLSRRTGSRLARALADRAEPRRVVPVLVGRRPRIIADGVRRAIRTDILDTHLEAIRVNVREVGDFRQYARALHAAGRRLKVRPVYKVFDVDITVAGLAAGNTQVNSPSRRHGAPAGSLSAE